MFAVGLFLALVRARHGHIAHCVGLHAGWVFVIKLTKDVTVDDPDARFSYLTGTYDNVIGLLALGLLTVLTAIYYATTTRGGSWNDTKNL